MQESRQRPQADLGKLFRRGSAWSIASYGGSQLLRLGSNLILWRLVTAEAFGLMALVNTLMTGLTMFSEIGIGPSIVQNERGDDRDYLNTAWTLQAMRGCALFLAACVAAYPAAHFYKQPELALLVPFVALSALINGFNSTKLFTASRQLELGPLTIIELSSQLAGIVVMLVLAWMTHSVWALACAALGTSIAQAGARLHACCRVRATACAGIAARSRRCRSSGAGCSRAPCSRSSRPAPTG